jgi:hypothetical protein
MRERDIEQYLVKRVKELGGEVRKVKWIGRAHAPDRVLFMPRGRLYWVETKAPGEEPRPGQAREFRRLAVRGHRVHVLDTIEKVDQFFRGLPV